MKNFTDGWMEKSGALPLLTAGNFAVIYYYKKFYFGVYSTVDFLFIPSRERDGGERLNIGLTRASGHLTVGFRI